MEETADWKNPAQKQDLLARKEICQEVHQEELAQNAAEVKLPAQAEINVQKFLPEEIVCRIIAVHVNELAELL